jgi:hypothetical protein
MKRIELKKRYIQKAYEIVYSEGKNNVTIRRLGNEINCNASSLYRCFNDMDELLLYVSLKYLKEYLSEVNELLKLSLSSIELYLRTWECFLQHSFRDPKMFDILFFNKYSMKMNYIITDYYSIFPEELEGFDDTLKSIFISESLSERNYKMLYISVEDGLIKKEDIRFLSDMIIQLYKGYLKDFLDKRKLHDNPEDVKKMQDEIMSYYRKILMLYIDEKKED